MRIAAVCLTVFAGLTPCLPAAAAAKPSHPAQAAPGAPPHAWLFGMWTGGLFPVLDGMATQDCQSQPTVAFSRDEVSHATLLSTTMTERTVVTVRATATGAEFRFTPAADPAASFGCSSPDELHVARASPDSISFPYCAAFPYSLQRCAPS